MQKATTEDREFLAPLRAELWRDALSVDQYRERNRRLYRHPFGQTRMETFVEKDESSRILTSMDVLKVDLLLKQNSGNLVEQRGILIASVFTPAAERGRGYSSSLLGSYFRANPQVNGVLYSDIGPFFYSRFGFAPWPMKSIVIRAEDQGDAELNEMDSTEFLERLSQVRRQKLRTCPAPFAAALNLDSEHLDWLLERYRFFAESVGKTFPRAISWRAEHPVGSHFFAAVPDFIASRLDVLWMDSHCPVCLSALHRVAARQELQNIRFWSPAERTSPGKIEFPMVRVAGARSNPVFIDPQFCDSW